MSYGSGKNKRRAAQDYKSKENPKGDIVDSKD